jgi:hypothetical protein
LDSGRLAMAIQAVNDAYETADEYIDVFYMDEADYDSYYWFGEEFFDPDEVPNPCVFYVNDSDVDKTESRYSSYTSLADRILEFLGY